MFNSIDKFIGFIGDEVIMTEKIKNRFKKRLKYKILSIFIMLSIILIGNSLWAVYNFNTLNQSIENIMVSNYRSIEAAQNMLVAIERQDSAELSYMFVKDENINSLFRENEKEFIKHLTVVESNITETGEEKIIEEINVLYTEYLKKHYSLQKMDLATETDQIQNYYYDEILPIFEETKLKTRELLAINQESMVSRKENAQEVAVRATYSTIFIAVLTIVLGLVVAYYLINQIIKPIYILIEKVKKIASGNYEQKIDIKRDDEISQLANEFNIMTTKLKSYRELNIKKLKEEKQKIEAIIDGIEDGIIVTDRDNKVVRINVITEEIFHIRYEKVINKHFLEVINNQQIFEKITHAQNSSEDFDINNSIDVTIEKSKQVKHYRVYARPIITKDNENIGVVTLLQDITKLKEIDQMKSDFISTVSHEFRTPLTSILMSVGLMKDRTVGKLNADQIELVSAIEEDSIRLKDLVSDLLDLSKMESGKIELDFDLHGVKSILKNSVKPFKTQIEAKNAKLKYNEADKDIYVKADFNKISWVLTNLISNAIRYIPDDGNGKIEIDYKETGRKVLFSVSDNGDGIPKDQQKKIFQKFIQSSGDDKAGSTGLGLAIAKEIINAHKGSIWVESEVGKGSTFYFTLYKK